MLKKLLRWYEDHPTTSTYIAMAMLAFFVIVVLSLASPKAHAADATVSWTAPTLNEDGSAIPATGDLALKQFVVTYGSCNTTKTGFTGTPTKLPVPATQTSVLISGFSFNTTQCFGVVAENNVGVQSSMSTVVSKTWTSPKPNPPVITTVSGLVWEVKLGPDGLRLARSVGTVAAGKPCQGLAPLMGDDLFVVYKRDVKLKKDVKRGATLVAQCDLS